MNVNGENLRFIMGFKLRQFRQQKGFSLKELAEKTNLSISYLSEIEKGKKYPKPEKILLLALALDISFDELVSLQINKDFGPLPVVFSSPVIKEFPFRMYGVKPQELLSLITGDPEKSGALIRTFLDIGQDYNMRVEHLLLAALRSYQQMHNNYFEDIENAAAAFILENGWQPDPPITAEQTRRLLVETHGYQIDDHILGEYPGLREMRSAWIEGKPPRLLMQPYLTPPRKAFIYCRELGFRFLNLKERPRATVRLLGSFEQLLNNFKAAYFAGALLMNRKLLVADLRHFLQSPQWNGAAFLDLIERYSVTPEMFLHRIGALLPHFFNMREMIFFRFQSQRGSDSFELSKIFNMTPLFIPNGMGAVEHHCRRWMSVQLLKRLKKLPAQADAPPLIEAQRVRFLNIKKTMFSITLAYPSPLYEGRLISVTISFMLNEAFKKAVAFWDDPAIQDIDVNETCERCGLTSEQCLVRAVPGAIFRKDALLREQEQALSSIITEIKSPG